MAGISPGKGHLHMCTEQSKPNIDPNEVSNPTMNATPIVGHSPPLLKWSKAVLASFRGERTKRGTTIANTPTTWMSKMIPSTSGNFLASDVLKMMAKATVPMTKRVPCHG